LTNNTKLVLDTIHDFLKIPRVFQYDTKEQKQTAMEIAEHLVCWSETCDIEAVILQRVDEPFPLFTKKDSAGLVEKYEKIYAEKKKKQLEDNMNKRKKNHEGETEVDGEYCNGGLGLGGAKESVHADTDNNETNRANRTSSNISKKNEINNENKTGGSEVPSIPGNKKLPKGADTNNVVKTEKVEPKRSPLELKPKVVEKPKKESLAPSKPVKKSKLNKLIKEK
jgi:hypothetical protein